MDLHDTKQLLPTRREIASRIFRQRTIFLATFLLVVTAFVVSGQFRPKYQAQMKVLIEKQRVDPVVTTGHDSTPELQTMSVREEDLNSQAEIFKGDDLARQVVLEVGIVPPGSSPAVVEKAVRKLEKHLSVGVIAKTDLIEIKYESPNADLSRRVLSTLARLYLQRQRNVEGPDFQVSFFDQQVREHGLALERSEARLLDFTRRTGVVSADLQRELAVRQVDELNQSKIQNTADMAQARGRAQQLAVQLLNTPARLDADQRRSDNPQLLDQLNATLLSQQLKRTDLLNKYDARYRLVQDVDREIAVTEGMIRAQLAAPLHEDSTSANPSRIALETEFSNTRAQLTGLEARASVLTRSVASMQKSSQDLAERESEQDALLRDVKTNKDVYQLYVDKLEQARMTQSLNRGGILNVAVAEPPSAPALPVNSTFVVLAACFFVSTLLSSGAAFLADIFDPTIRNASDLSGVAGLPTLAEFGPISFFKGGRA